MSFHTSVPENLRVQFYQRAVVREVLIDILVNMNSFSDTRAITMSFTTNHPGTKIPARLRMSHPEKITIQLLKDCFMNFTIDYFYIYVSLKFMNDGPWEQLVIPFSALLYFRDSSTAICQEFKLIPDEFMERVLNEQNLISLHAI